MNSKKFWDQIEQGIRRFRGVEVGDLAFPLMELYDLDLEDCTFYGTKFNSARIEGLKAKNCKFIKCDFNRAQMMESHFIQTSFHHITSSCTFYEADCRHCTFTECDLRLVGFERTRLFKSTFQKCNGVGTIFHRADFNNAAKMIDCNFSMVDLRDAQLEKCDLHKTNFEQADLREANFTKANLTECNFAGATTKHMKIKDADMRGANIAQLDLRALDFTGVTLYEEQGKVLLENLGINVIGRIQSPN